MIITGKLLEVTEVRDVTFIREGVQRTLRSISFLLQWFIYSDSGKKSSQEMVAEILYDVDKAPDFKVGKITDDNFYDITVYFHANRTKDGRVFNSIRIYKYAVHSETFGSVE